MAKRKRNRARSAERKEPRSTALRPGPERQPEPRPHFHYERRPGYGGDYDIQLTLLDAGDGGQAVVGRIRPPGGQAFELTRRKLDRQGPPLESDAAKAFGVPAGLDPALMRQILWECRSWVQRDNVRRRRAMAADDGSDNPSSS